jgi:hypothetical protein
MLSCERDVRALAVNCRKMTEAVAEIQNQKWGISENKEPRFGAVHSDNDLIASKIVFK